MTNSRNTNSGCFSCVLRRLLCASNPSTHTSESTGAEFTTPETDAKRRVPAAEPGPGVVARLMGLNSLPDTDWAPKQRAPDAISRSRSVNFVDYLLDFDPSQTRHRRVRTSASFREVTPFMDPQSEFLVVYMKDFDNKKETESKSGKSEMGLKEVEKTKEQSNNVKKKTKQSGQPTKNKKENQRNENKISKLKDEPRRKIGKNYSKNRNCNGSRESVSVLPSYKQRVPNNGGAVNSISNRKKKTMQNQKEACSGSKLKKTKNKMNIRHAAKKTEPESDPENSSPISVLDVDRIDFSDEVSRLRMEMGLKKCQDTNDQMGECAIKKKDYDSKGRGEIDLYSEMVGRICRLADEEIREENWSFKSAYKFAGFEELCMELERHIVHVLLVQTLVELL